MVGGFPVPNVLGLADKVVLCASFSRSKAVQVRVYGAGPVRICRVLMRTSNVALVSSFAVGSPVVLEWSQRSSFTVRTISQILVAWSAHLDSREL